MSKVDVLIITALKAEFEAAREAALQKAPNVNGITSWEEKDLDTPTPYLVGDYNIQGKGKLIKIALARPTRMGVSSTAPVTANLVTKLGPFCLAMCGVCAGNPKELSLGDVIIAEMVYAYDEGSKKTEGFEGDHRQILLNDSWFRFAQELKAEELPSFGKASDLDAQFWILEKLYNGQNPRTHPGRERYFVKGSWSPCVVALERKGLISKAGRGFILTASGKCFVEDSFAYNVDPPEKLPFSINTGPIASGNVVVKDGLTWDVLKALGVRTVLGLEMEGATIGNTAHRLQVPHWIVVKGVMDYADSNKDDRYKGFGARASAEALFLFLEKHFSPGIRSKTTTKIAISPPSQLPLYQDKATFERIVDAVGRNAPHFERILLRARDIALQASKKSEEAELLAATIRQELGIKLSKAHESI
jgi:nucleoside phosphorylase